MIPAHIEGCTRVLGAPIGWTPETSGPCRGLPIRDEANGDMPAMVSAWEPTPAEVAAIAAGAKVMLRVVGTGHPPVMIWVGEAPSEEASAASVGRNAERQDAEERLGPKDEHAVGGEADETPKSRLSQKDSPE